MFDIRGNRWFRFLYGNRGSPGFDGAQPMLRATP